MVNGQIINGYDAETRINVTVRVDVLGKDIVVLMAVVCFIMELVILASNSGSLAAKAATSLVAIGMFLVIYLPTFFRVKYSCIKAKVFLKNILQAKE